MHATLLALLLSLAPAAPAADASLEEIAALARGGAHGLSLRLLDEFQSAPDVAPAAWTAAEHQRVEILAARGDWAVLAERLASLDPELPRPFLDWAAARRADALLQLGDGAGARAALLPLVWSDGARGDALRAWRAAIIRSYVVDGDTDAALTALQRFALDHGADDGSLRAVHGEVLLAAGRATDAVQVLGDADDPLAWLARLRAGAAAPGAVFERAVRTGSARDANGAVRHASWRVAAEAARRMNNAQAAVAALERALASADRSLNLPRILEVGPDELWAAYHEWGRALGNASQLIVGVDQGWIDAAEQAESPQARALFAALSGFARQPQVVEFAHYRFARSLRAEPGGDRVLAALYLESGEFATPDDVPAMVRYLLVDYLLRQGEIVLASRLVADLEAAPADVDPGEWGLRRARVLVLAGRPQDGAAALSSLLDGGAAVDTDRLMQVLFDLQSAGAHREALALFDRVGATAELDVQRRRELLYWMADSRRALGDDAEAARLYLRSAGLEDPYALDPWAQTARFQAAEALAAAGLHDDAAAIIRTLLNATDDPGRRAVLQQRLDQLTRGADEPPV